MNAGNNSITSFNGGSITVSIPYTLRDGEDPSKLYVVYVNESGATENMAATYSNGVVSFETTHLSLYSIAYDTEGNVVEIDEPSSSSGSSNNPLLMIVGVVIGAVIGAVVMFFILRKH